jgi:hypothetical protein
MRRSPSETFCTRKNVLLTLHVAGVSNVLSPSVFVIFNTHRHIHVLKDDSLGDLRQLSRDRMVAISLAKYFKGVKCSNKNMKKKKLPYLPCFRRNKFDERRVQILQSKFSHIIVKCDKQQNEGYL